MSVYKRSYKGYTGGFTPTWSRFLILPRYGYSRVFQSKFIITFLVACFFFPLGCMAYVYLAHNLTVLSTLEHSRRASLQSRRRLLRTFSAVFKACWLIC